MVNRLSFLIVLHIMLFPCGAMAQSLSSLEVTIPKLDDNRIKVDLLAHELVAQIDRHSDSPVGLVLEHTICKFNVGPERRYKEGMEEYHFMAKPSPYPQFVVPPGSYDLKHLSQILQSQGLLVRIEEERGTIHLLQQELIESVEWPLNMIFDEPLYGAVDATKCREILAVHGITDQVEVTPFLNVRGTYYSSMVFDFSDDRSVRAILGTIAKTFAQAEGRGAVAYVSTWPPSLEIDRSDDVGTANWSAAIFLGAHLLKPGLDEPYEWKSTSE